MREFGELRVYVMCVLCVLCDVWCMCRVCCVCWVFRWLRVWVVMCGCVISLFMSVGC